MSILDLFFRENNTYFLSYYLLYYLYLINYIYVL